MISIFITLQPENRVRLEMRHVLYFRLKSEMVFKSYDKYYSCCYSFCFWNSWIPCMYSIFFKPKFGIYIINIICNNNSQCLLLELAWSEWSPCSSTCNWGRRTRTSYCVDNGLNLESCGEASSKRSETEACFVKLCPSSSTTMSSTTTMTTTLSPISVYNKSIGNLLSDILKIVL